MLNPRRVGVAVLFLLCTFSSAPCFAVLWNDTSAGSRVRASNLQQIRNEIDARRSSVACGSAVAYPWATGASAVGQTISAAQFNEVKIALSVAPLTPTAASALIPVLGTGDLVKGPDVALLQVAVDAASCGGPLCDGDASCEAGESCATCADCAAPICNSDGTCDMFAPRCETDAACPADNCAALSCNNNSSCEAGEDCGSCADCATPACNSNGFCDSFAPSCETNAACPADKCGPAGCDNDAICEAGEDCGSCADCAAGSCNSDLACDWAAPNCENKTTCAGDCACSVSFCDPCKMGHCECAGEPMICPPGAFCWDDNPISGNCYTCSVGCPPGVNCTYDGGTDTYTCLPTCGAGGCQAGESCGQPDYCPGDCPCPDDDFCNGTACIDYCADGVMTRDETGVDCGGTFCPACPVCGNSKVDAGEDCDDGPANGVCPATCSATCTANACGVCGDGKVDLGEVCDDGPANGVCPATCSATCTANVCGACGPDGTPCDDGSQCTSPDTCTGGVCGGPDNYCDDSDDCTQDRCVSGTACAHDPLTGYECGGPPAGSPYCQDHDICNSGVCIGPPMTTAPHDGYPCLDADGFTPGLCNGGTCVTG